MRGRARGPIERGEAWLARALVAPALATILLVALAPLAWTAWESLHVHDLRMPWRGYPFVGLSNYVAALGDPRFREAALHTALYMAATVSLELVLGLALALALDRAFRGRGLVRAAVIVPWALPTVVSALLWRFMFEGPTGVANATLVKLGILSSPVEWFADPLLAWVPIVLADVWKTTPFVALLLLAGLQNVDRSLLEAAAMDGAGRARRLVHVTLPLLRPALLVALIFRSLDALRVFDLVWVMTGGGPGTSTEPVALYAFNALLQNLRFGYGSALSLLIFALAFALALLYVRALGSTLAERAR